jgi:hypothetical protein
VVTDKDQSRTGTVFTVELKMAKFINFLFALVWFVYLLCSGIHLFSKGFLLSRVAQTEFTTCNKFDELQCTGNSNDEVTLVN